jgi:4-hydroxymandelate oxidase
MAFAVCDQGSAAAFTGLRIARDYAAGGVRRALLIVVEQAALPYDCTAALPVHHQGVALLYGESDQAVARLVDLRQHPGVPAAAVAPVAAAGLAELAAGHRDIVLVMSGTLAPAWPAPVAGRVRVAAPGQPVTGLWAELADELTVGSGRPGLVVAADYDPDLSYLCLSAFTTASAS